MTSPTTLRFAVVASFGLTGGAIYYFLSEGGDPKVAQEKVDEARQRVIEESEKLHVIGVERLGQAKQVLDKAREKVVETSRTMLTNEEPEPVQVQPSPPPEEKQVAKREPYCHTCSGPRIWFFAEKLRLKRRFTPYPDPPRE